MGAIAMLKADQVVVTSDNPRSERPEAIIAQILLGMVQSDNCDVQADRALAIAETIDAADACDVILLAGKGHEDTQDIAGVKHPFSDRVHATRALAARKQNLSKGRA
jgi:UDP-N-acetylmuramoyl-L-alanyl-D-glutamate--2,6-diaminopimelate ligase